MVNPLSLTVDACEAAVADAGLTFADIDGLSTYPGPDIAGMGEGGVTALEGRQPAANVDQRRHGHLRSGWLGDRRGDGGGDRDGQTRAVLPHPVGVDLPGSCSRRAGWLRPVACAPPAGRCRSVPCRPRTPWRSTPSGISPLRHDPGDLGWIALNQRANARAESDGDLPAIR